MMPQMESNQPTSEQPGSTYGRYEGSSQYAQPEYDEPRGRSPQNPALDDNFVEAVAQRMVQHLAQQGTAGKVYAPPRTYDKNVLRIIVGIISMLIIVALMFMLGATWLSAGAWVFGAAAFAIFILAVVIIDKIK